MHRANKQPESRAASSNNWRLPAKPEETHREKPSNEQKNRPAIEPDSESVPAAIAEGRRLYVGNLLYIARIEDVESLFPADEYKVERVNMAVDPFTGRNPSYCFVELETREQAEKAMQELNGKEILGRPVKVKPGVPKSHRNQISGKATAPMHDDEDSPRFAFDRWERTDAAKHWRDYGDGQRLFVGGLPRVSDQLSVNHEIIKLFHGFTIEAVSKLISPVPSTRPRYGYGYYLFVDLPSAEEATEAMEAVDGKDSPWGGTVRVQKSSKFSRKVEEREFFAQRNGKSESKTSKLDSKVDSQTWRRPVDPF